MSDITTLLRVHLLNLWHYRWLALLIAWLVSVAGWGVVMALPDNYVSTARIYVDTDSMLRPLMRGIAADTNLLSEIDMMQRTLLSQPNLLKVARMADLDLNVKTAAEQEELVLRLQKRLKVVGQGRNLFSITYEDASPEAAKKVVESLLTIFVEGNLGATRKDTLNAIRFVDDQIRDYERLLDEAERRVTEFKEANIGYLPGADNFSNKAEAARAEAAKTQADLDEHARKRDELKRQLADVPAFVEVASVQEGAGPPVSSGPAVGTDVQAGIAELENNIEVLLRKYTERHPDVVAARRSIERLRKQAEEQAAAAPVESPAPSPAPRATRTQIANPVHEQLKLQLVAEDGEVARLRARLERQLAEVKKWESLARNVPGVEAEMAKLKRDHDVIKRNYDELVHRRQSAKIAQDLDTQAERVQFRVIDPPQVPSKPVGPNRRLFAAVVWVAGVVSGGGFGIFLGLINQSVASLEQLRAAVKVPVLGSVGFVASTRQRRRQAVAAVSFAGACAALVIALAGVLVADAQLGVKLAMV